MRARQPGSSGTDQTGHSASVYLSGPGGRPLVPAHTYKFDRNVHSMLMQDMDGDGHPDMVVEGDNGVLALAPCGLDLFRPDGQRLRNQGLAHLVFGRKRFFPVHLGRS